MPMKKALIQVVVTDPGSLSGSSSYKKTDHLIHELFSVLAVSSVICASLKARSEMPWSQQSAPKTQNNGNTLAPDQKVNHLS